MLEVLRCSWTWQGEQAAGPLSLPALAVSMVTAAFSRTGPPQGAFVHPAPFPSDFGLDRLVKEVNCELIRPAHRIDYCFHVCLLTPSIIVRVPPGFQASSPLATFLWLVRFLYASRLPKSLSLLYLQGHGRTGLLATAALALCGKQIVRIHCVTFCPTSQRHTHMMFPVWDVASSPTFLFQLVAAHTLLMSPG